MKKIGLGELYVSRDRLVDGLLYESGLLEKTGKGRLIHFKSPRATGKTSLASFIRQKAEDLGFQVYVINSRNLQDAYTVATQIVDQKVLLIIDEAQLTFRDEVKKILLEGFHIIGILECHWKRHFLFDNGVFCPL